MWASAVAAASKRTGPGKKLPGPVDHAIGCAFGAGPGGLLALEHASAAGCAAGRSRVTANIGGGVAFLPDSRAGDRLFDRRFLRTWAVDRAAAIVGQPGSAGPD